jgi:hypothetical protein
MVEKPLMEELSEAIRQDRRLREHVYDQKGLAAWTSGSKPESARCGIDRCAASGVSNARQEAYREQNSRQSARRVRLHFRGSSAGMAPAHSEAKPKFFHAGHAEEFLRYRQLQRHCQGPGVGPTV